jgi:hypothetical protein
MDNHINRYIDKTDDKYDHHRTVIEILLRKDGSIDDIHKQSKAKMIVNIIIHRRLLSKFSVKRSY